jgi:hypothetical protein
MSQQIFELIPKVMADVGVIEKAKKNAQQGYKFRGIDDVFSAFQPVLAKHQIFYVPEVLTAATTDRETKSGGTLIYTNLTVAYTFYAPDGSNIRAVVVGEAMDSADKSSNKAMSAALKYALLQIFCVPTEALEDADAQTHELKSRTITRLESVKTEAVSETAKSEEEPSPTLFWKLQREYGVEKTHAQTIVTESGRDWNAAISRLKSIIPQFQENLTANSKAA